MQSDSNLALSSRLSIGDYIPHALIETTEQRLDIQSKAGEPNIFVVLSEAHGALAPQALGLAFPYRHFVLTETASDSTQHKRVFSSVALYLKQEALRLKGKHTTLGAHPARKE